MNLYEFNTLPFARQLALVFDAGAFLATRWEETIAFNLYELPGRFFVEVAYDTACNALVGHKSFRSAGPLEAYAAGVVLPDGW